MDTSLSNGLKKNGSVDKQSAAIRRIKTKIQVLSNELHETTSSEVYKKLSLQVNDILKDVNFEVASSHSENDRLCQVNTIDKIKIKQENCLPDKIFKPRDSLLTDLWANKNIGTIYHIFLAMLFALFVHAGVHDIIHQGTRRLGFNLILKSFPHLHMVLFIWICMFLTTFAVYFVLYLWSKVRITIKDPTTWDRLCCTLYLFYVASFIYLYTNMVIYCKITTAEAVGVLCEMTRFLMKSHAYVRSNVPTIKKSGQTKEFSRFLYFLFAPTLIYQDVYPRSKNIRWKYVALCFTEVLGCIMYISFLFERFLVPDFEHFGLKETIWQNVILIILGNGIAGILMLLCTFYAILHSWHNGFAEMLRFADRMFYKDWWVSTSFGRFYNTWNVVVHDWLYMYVYKDFYELVVPNNKVAAKLMVFLISATFHEFILGFGFGFCFPILFILFFVFGLSVSSIRIKYELLGNFGIWYSLSLGMAIAMCTYCMEFFARINCPSVNNSITDYFIPRSIFVCNV